jgi:hypothetical protein
MIEQIRKVKNVSMSYNMLFLSLQVMLNAWSSSRSTTCHYFFSEVEATPFATLPGLYFNLNDTLCDRLSLIET